MKFLNGMTKTEFFEKNWEQKALFIPQAVEIKPDFFDLKSLQEMACDDYYETRLVSIKDTEVKLSHGPFHKSLFERMNEKWTLIVHNLNLYMPAAKFLEETVSFIPRFLFDDVMCTYSTKDSTIGAHIDNYSVFILQVEGQRKWSIQREPDHSYQDGLEVKILENFEPDEEYILNPGDMIYIPPGVAHCGESLSDSISLSTGFKSIEDKALIDQVCIDGLNEFESDEFYKTNFQQEADDNQLISNDIISDLHQRIREELCSEKLMNEAIVKHSSKTKFPTEEIEFDEEDFIDLRSSHKLYKDEHMRMAAIKLDDNLYLIGMNSKVFYCNEQSHNFFTQVKINHASEAIDLVDEMNDETKDIIIELVEEGIFFFEE